MKNEKIRQCVAIYPRLSKTQFKIVDTLSFLSKNMFNVGLYNVRQYFHIIQQNEIEKQNYRPDITKNLVVLTNSYLPYSRKKEHPFKEICNYNSSNPNENYGLLHSQAAQQTLKSVEEGYISFFKLLVMKSKGEYDKPAHPPHYLEKNGRYKVDFPRAGLTFKGNKVTLGMSVKFRKFNGYTGKELTFTIPSSIKSHQICEITLLPVHNGRCYKILFSYEVKKLPVVNLDNTKHMSLDLGVNNFATILDNVTGTTTLLDGKYLKSINQWYNKENARLQSIKDKQGITGITKRQHQMLVKRENKINEAMNRFANQVIEYALESKIGNITCLRWDGIKNKRKAQKKDNQNFIQIPFDKFRQKLKGKCKLYGIKYHGEESEAYTSQTDALAFDEIKKQPYGKTRRIKRGLYKSITGHVINADVNGSLNQMRKVAGDDPIKDIISRGLFNLPRRVRHAYEPATLFKKMQPAMCTSNVPSSVAIPCL